MALINHAKKEINAKIVYAGPGAAGKETTLRFIYQKLRSDFRGPLKSARLQDDSMLFFDFMPPVEGGVQGYTVRFHLYTLPGEPTDYLSWKMLLKGVDGLVFVADLSAGRLGQNRASLDQLQELLELYGKGLASMPLTVQANKRDSADAVSLDELRQILGRAALPMIAASALDGEGVLESLFQVVKAVLKELRDSGLALETAPERVDSSAEPPMPAVPEPGPVQEPAPSIPADSEETGQSLTTEPFGATSSGGLLQPVFTMAGESASPADSGISVSFAAIPSLVGGAELSIPLLITAGGFEKRVSLTLSLVGGNATES